MKTLTASVCALALALLTSCDRPESESAVTPGTNHPSMVPPAPATEETQETLERPRVRLQTTHGDLVIELFETEAPVTVANFLQYVRDGHYDGTVFHRVIDGFMIQAGGFRIEDGRLVEKETRSPIRNEASNGLTNDRGTVAMARTGNPDSATAQFFINTVANAGLNRPSPDGHGYAVFGQVVEGMETVDRIEKIDTKQGNLVSRHPQSGQMIAGPADDVPVEPVVIEAATVVE